LITFVKFCNTFFNCPSVYFCVWFDIFIFSHINIIALVDNTVNNKGKIMNKKLKTKRK
jgi:hypothetical protein